MWTGGAGIKPATIILVDNPLHFLIHSRTMKTINKKEENRTTAATFLINKNIFQLHFKLEKHSKFLRVIQVESH